jgi:hypothetical protein
MAYTPVNIKISAGCALCSRRNRQSIGDVHLLRNVTFSLALSVFTVPGDYGPVGSQSGSGKIIEENNIYGRRSPSSAVMKL